MATDDKTPDFETLARQYWNAWGQAMRDAGVPGAQAAPGAAAPEAMQAWHEAVDWWSKLAHGGRADVDDAVERFNTQAHDWYGRMQQVAAQFAGQPANAGDIADAWKRALGASGENPFPEMLRSLRGHGLQGMQQWAEDASPYLDAWKREATSWLGMPTFGLAREHQERWQALARLQLDYQQCSDACNALMAGAGQRAFELFEARLAERSGTEDSDDKLASARALFDMWIDVAEEAYAEVALSPEYRKAYGELANAQMRLRAAVQGEVERSSELFGMPTRSEVDAAHRKVAQLEREVRRLRDALDGQAQASSGRVSSASKPAGKAKPSAKKAAGKKPSGKKPVAKKAAAKAVASGKQRRSAGPSPQPSPGGRGGKSTQRRSVGSSPQPSPGGRGSKVRKR